MAIVVGIKFKNTGKTYYFSPKDIEFCEKDGVITETVRGIEYGTISISNREVPESEIVAPLKEVIRKATEEDKQKHQENINKRPELIRIINEKILKHDLVMKIVDAEYTFDRSKLMIYFTSDGRVDFRELVKDLASVFHIRIELRQIYERDDIKMRGALGICGRPCCCTIYLKDFEKVSIKMAKTQGLSLNPTKISGCCGKLMCCLKYENDYYKDTLAKMPKESSKVNTPDGEGVVLSNDVMKLKVRVRVTVTKDTYEIKEYDLEEIRSGEKQTQQDTKQNKNDMTTSKMRKK